MDIIKRLTELSKNLYWAWHPECVKVFRDINTELWRDVNLNPIDFLNRLANDVLENEVVPLFYNRNEDGIPHGWVARQKHALRTLTWRFSAQRMVMDYTLSCYLPAAGGLTSSVTADVRLLKEAFKLPDFARQPWIEEVKSKNV